MTVSVIIPNYRHADFLAARIETVLGQTWQDFEVLILDDASPDRSREVIERYVGGRVRFLGNERNSGSTFVQWERGLRETSGEYVWIAESDDEAAPEFLERMLGALRAVPEAGFAYCQAALIDAAGRQFGLALPAVDADGKATGYGQDFVRSGPEELARCLRKMVAPVPNASSVLFRRQAVAAAGGVDPSFRLCGDVDLYARLAMRGPVAYVAAPLNRYRHHPGTVRAQTGRDGVGIMERYRLVTAFRQRTGGDWPTQPICLQHLAGGWAAAALRRDGRLSRDTNRRIWQEARQADPKLVRRVMVGLWDHAMLGVRRRLGLRTPCVD